MGFGSFAGGLAQGLTSGGSLGRQVAMEQAHLKLQQQQQDLLAKFREAEMRRYAEQAAVAPLDRVTTPETAEAALPYRSGLLQNAADPTAEVAIPGFSETPGIDLSTGQDMPGTGAPVTMSGMPARERLYSDAGRAVSEAHRKALENAFTQKQGMEEMKLMYKTLGDQYKAARSLGVKHEDAIRRLKLSLIQDIYKGKAQIPNGMTIDDVLNSAVSNLGQVWSPTSEIDGQIQLPGNPPINPPRQPGSQISAVPGLPPVSTDLGVAPVPPPLAGEGLSPSPYDSGALPPPGPAQGEIGPPGAQQSVAPNTKGKLPVLTRPANTKDRQMLADAREAEGYLGSLADAFSDPRGPKTGLIFAIKTNPTFRAMTSLLPAAMQPDPKDAGFSSALGNHILTYARSKFPGRISNFDVQFLQEVVPRPQYTPADNRRRSEALKRWAQSKRKQIEQELSNTGFTVPEGDIPHFTTQEMTGSPEVAPIPPEWK